MITSEQAYQILETLCLMLDGKLPSSHKNPSDYPKQPEMEYADEQTWMARKRHQPIEGNTRTEAYLRAYLAIGGDRFAATGIQLSDGCYLRPDAGVMKSLLVAHAVQLEQGHFELTTRGRAFLRGEAAARGREVV